MAGSSLALWHDEHHAGRKRWAGGKGGMLNTIKGDVKGEG